MLHYFFVAQLFRLLFLRKDSVRAKSDFVCPALIHTGHNRAEAIDLLFDMIYSYIIMYTLFRLYILFTLCCNFL